MGFFRRREPKQPWPEPPPAAVGSLNLREHEFSFDGDDETRIFGRGYELCRGPDPDDERILYNDPDLHDAGVRIFHVAGVTFRGGDPWTSAFDPGQPVVLQREPDNRYDPHAVRVLDRTRRLWAGYVPKDVAPDVASALDAGFDRSGLVLAEFIKDGRRCGLTVMCGPGLQVSIT